MTQIAPRRQAKTLVPISEDPLAIQRRREPSGRVVEDGEDAVPGSS
jgi:hypothetical protein